jgi:hypothetical protein
VKSLPCGVRKCDSGGDLLVLEKRAELGVEGAGELARTVPEKELD